MTVAVSDVRDLQVGDVWLGYTVREISSDFPRESVTLGRGGHPSCAVPWYVLDYFLKSYHGSVERRQEPIVRYADCGFRLSFSDPKLRYLGHGQVCEPGKWKITMEPL